MVKQTNKNLLDHKTMSIYINKIMNTIYIYIKNNMSLSLHVKIHVLFCTICRQ